jgi:hypothetical protein
MARFDEAFARAYGTGGFAEGMALGMKKWLAEQENKLAMQKMGYLPTSQRPQDKYKKVVVDGQTVPTESLYTEYGGQNYRYNPQTAMMQIAPYLALGGNTDALGFGTMFKGIRGGKPQFETDTPAEQWKRASELRKDLEDRPEVKDFITINTNVKSMDSLLSKALSGDVENKVSLDQALITMYNKLTDPASVVRESEYARTPANLPIVNRFMGAIQKIEQGGAGMTNSDREALVWGAKVIADERGKTYNETLSNFTDLSKEARVKSSMVTRGFKPHIPYGATLGKTKAKSFKKLWE